MELAYKTKPRCVEVSSDRSFGTMRLLALLLVFGAAGKDVRTLTRSHRGSLCGTIFSCWPCLFCGRVQVRQFPVGMARSLADGSVSLTPVRSWPPLTTDTTSAVVCSSTTSGCSLSLTVGTSKSTTVDGRNLSHIAAFIFTLSLLDLPHWFPSEKHVHKNICTSERVWKAVSWATLTCLEIFPWYYFSKPLCHADPSGRARCESFWGHGAAHEDWHHHLAREVSLEMSLKLWLIVIFFHSMTSNSQPFCHASLFIAMTIRLWITTSCWSSSSIQWRWLSQLHPSPCPQGAHTVATCALCLDGAKQAVMTMVSWHLGS